jgi:YesN/AraC family two-component response regulator
MSCSNKMTQQKCTLLLIDDNPSNLQMLVDILRDYGFVLMTALNGKDGLQIAQKGQPDLILLDIMMPGMDGFETCRCLKENAATQEIPVIFLSVSAQVENKVKGFNLGGIDYITKPISEAEVLARITSHLNQYQLQHNLTKRLQAYEQHFGPLDSETALAKSSEHSSSLKLKQVCQARDKLLNNLAYNPSLDELAHSVGTNRNSLSQAFHAYFGMSVFTWLREQRLQKADALLRETDWPIQKISQTVGYGDSNHFSTCFKRRFGVSPRQSRKTSDGNKESDEGNKGFIFDTCLQ